MKIIDCHCHIYPEKIAEKAGKAIGDFYDIQVVCGGTCADLLFQWKAYGVDKILFGTDSPMCHIEKKLK